MKQRLCLLMLLLVALAACNQTAETQLGQTVEIDWNQFAAIPSENLTIGFLDIVDDSRCPEDAECIAPGDVTVLIRVMQDGVRLVDAELTLAESAESVSTAAGEYKLTLFDVAPDNPTDEPGQYAVTFTIDRVAE